MRSGKSGQMGKMRMEIEWDSMDRLDVALGGITNV